MNTVYIDNDNVITLDQAFDVITALYLNSATVTVTLLDGDDVAVTGQTFPLTMDYVAASDGKYRAVLEDALELSASPGRYTAVINLDAGGGRKANWRAPVFAAIRTE